MHPTFTYSRTAICAILAMYACAAHAQRQAPIRDIAPIIESSVTQQYQPPLDTLPPDRLPQAETAQRASTMRGRELNACLERKQQIDNQQQKLGVLARDLQRDKQLVGQLERRIEQEKPKRQTHSVAAMNSYQALLKQYEQQANSLNERTVLYNQLAEHNGNSVRQYNKTCSGKAYSSAQLPPDSPHAVQAIRQPADHQTAPATTHTPSAYPSHPTQTDNHAGSVPGVPSVGGY